MENPYDALERIIQTLIDVMGFEGSCSVKTLIPVVKKLCFIALLKPRENTLVFSSVSTVQISMPLNTLFALSHIKKALHNVHVDINDYKDDKDRMITAIAKMLQIKRIVKKKPIVLRPMNAYERRIVHTVAGSDERVSSESIGEG